MANFNIDPNLSFTVTMILTEKEARALLNISSYGPNNVASWIIPKLTQSKANETEEGLVSILSEVALTLKPLVTKIDNARKLINES